MTIHQAPWLVGVLIFLLTTPTLVSKWAADHLPGWTGAAGRWWQDRRLRVAAEDRADRTAARLQALEADYTELRDAQARQVDVLQSQLDAQGRQLESQAGEIGRLRSTISKLDADLTSVTRRFWIAVGYVRLLADSLRKHAEVPAPPDELRDIL